VKISGVAIETYHPQYRPLPVIHYLDVNPLLTRYALFITLLAPHAVRPCTLRLARSHRTHLAPRAPRASHLMLRTRPAPRAVSTSLHWAATSRWAHVATLCFIRFRYMLHMFHLNVAKVDLVLHILQWLYTYVASVCFKCFNYFKTNVVNVLFGYCICCCGYIYVASVCSKSFTCFRPMLQVFNLDVAYVSNILTFFCTSILLCI
jgi:hypothetical protein